ncbi:MAG TPA: antitoxin VbhA family protein [Solirubrobacteraceae bacterium]|nr:antitoxin VbhA family protein [Solirubrobacteraceae bacterium]
MRLAGAEPSPEVVELGMGWVRGELDADDLAYAAEQAAAGVPFTGRPAAGKPE